MLDRLNVAANRGDSIDEILELAHDETGRIFQTHVLTLYWLSDDKKYLTLDRPIVMRKKWISGIEKLIGMEIPRDIKIPLDRAPNHRRILNSPASIIINDPKEMQELMSEFTDNPAIRKLIPAIHKITGYKSIIYIPLTMHGELVGMADISSKGEFKESDIKRFKIIVNQIAHIIKRRAMEKALREGEEKYRSIFNNTGTAMLIIEEDMTISLANKEVFGLYGYAPEKVTGRKWTEFVAPEELDKMKEWHVQRRIDPENTPKRYEFRLLDAHGNTKNVLLKIDMIPGSKKSIASMIDITRRKKAELTLEQSEGRFNEVIEHSMEWVWEIDKEGKFTYASHMCQEIYGYSPEELIGKYFYELAAPNARDKMKESSFEELISRKKSFRNTLNRCQRRDGKLMWIRSSGFPVLDENGNLRGYRGSDIDVTEQVENEKALKESEEKFRAVFNEALDGIVLATAEDGRIVDANSEFQRMCGRSINQLRTMHIWDIRPDDEIQRAEMEFKGMEKGTDAISFDNFLQPSGKIIPVEFKAHKVTIRGREYILSIVRDVTDRLRAQESLVASEEKFRELFEESLDAVYISDTDGIITDMNPAGCRMFGYEREEMLGTSALERYFQPEDRKRLLEEIAEKGSVRNFEVVLKKKDGSNIICLITTASKKDAAGNIIGYQGIIHDITDRIIIEQKYRAEFQRAEFYNDLMSHDVRNYNQGIMSNLELLGMLDDLPEKAKLFAGNALNQVIGSSRLINNLQTLSNLKHKKIELNDMDVIPFIEEAIDYTKTSFSDKKITINFPDEDSSIIVKGNSMIQEVFINILSNAAKFDRNREVKLDIRISGNDDFYKFEFMDRGPGVKDEMKSGIFDRNVKTDDDTGGTGLGLTLVKRIVENLDGEIHVEDRVKGNMGKGSNFVLTLPRGDAPG